MATTLADLRTTFQAIDPVDALRSLEAHYNDPKTSPKYEPPRLTVVLRSGYFFTGYFMSSHEDEHAQEKYVFTVENRADAEGFDICYVPANRIEAVMVINVDRHPEIMPRLR
jgi:hypothetical protein